MAERRPFRNGDRLRERQCHQTCREDMPSAQGSHERKAGEIHRRHEAQRHTKTGLGGASVDDPVRARTLCSLIRKDLAEEYAGIEESISVKCRECSVDKRLTGDSSSSMIDLLLALPHGVEK